VAAAVAAAAATHLCGNVMGQLHLLTTSSSCHSLAGEEVAVLMATEEQDCCR